MHDSAAEALRIRVTVLGTTEVQDSYSGHTRICCRLVRCEWMGRRGRESVDFTCVDFHSNRLPERRRTLQAACSRNRSFQHGA